MCSVSTLCKQKNSCYRFRKIPHEHWQPYSMLYEPHPNDPNIKCVNFVSIEGKPIKEQNDL